MWFFPFDLIRAYAVDLLGFAACAATLLTFAQKQMWPMRISAIAANIFFIGYGALGLLYPVLLLHLVLLPLNVARLIQLIEQDRQPQTAGLVSLSPTVPPEELQQSPLSPPFGGGQWRANAGNLRLRSPGWDHFGPAPL